MDTIVLSGFEWKLQHGRYREQNSSDEHPVAILTITDHARGIEVASWWPGESWDEFREQVAAPAQSGLIVAGAADLRRLRV